MKSLGWWGKVKNNVTFYHELFLIPGQFQLFSYYEQKLYIYLYVAFDSFAGSFGVAILYRRKIDNHHIVFKQINLTDLTPSERDLAMNEVEVFSKLHHPNIIR